MNSKPRLIFFDKIGENRTGFLSVAQGLKHIPFKIKRVFWTYKTPTSTIRGTHAHKLSTQIIIAVNGTIKIQTETKSKNNFTLKTPSVGLLVPPLCWLKIKFSKNAVMFTLASTDYDSSEYIRDYRLFKKTINKKRT